MSPPEVLVLGRRDVARLLDQDACIAAVEDAFRLQAEGRCLGPGVLGIPSGRALHVKARPRPDGPVRGKVKRQSRNPYRCDLTAIQGVVILATRRRDRSSVLDSIE